MNVLRWYLQTQDFIVLEGLSIFDLESVTTVQIKTYKIHLQSSKMTDLLKGQMPLYFQSVENKLHERKQKSVGSCQFKI